MATPQIVQRQLDAAELIQQQLAAPAEQVPQETVPEVVEAPPAPPTPPSENWEHKFRTLQGKYNAEIPELRAQNRTYESQLGQLTQQVNALTEVAKTAAAKPQERAQVDPKDVESFGADLIEMVQRYAEQSYGAIKNEFGSFASKLDARVAELEGRVQGVTQRTAATLEEQFYTTLAKLVPDWQAVNQDQKFLDWLAEVDPIYGVPRQMGLNQAHKSLSADHAAKVFQTYKSSIPAKPALSAQVAPRSSAATQTPAPQGARAPITKKQIHDFYLAQAQGRYKGREAEAQRLENDINSAVAEGRVV
jgi:outer membrane murein-binding lipoprotein Lpp